VSGRRAGASELFALDKELQREGREFLTAFYATLRALGLYPLENQTVQNALSELEQCSSKLLEQEGEIVFRPVGDFFFLNNERLKVDLGSYATFGAIARAIRRHGIGEIGVENGAGRADWVAFLTVLRATPPDEDPYSAFLERLSRSAVRHIRTDSEKKSGDHDEVSDTDRSKEAAKRTFAKGVNVARELLTGVRMGKSVSLRKVKRAVQSVVDQVLNNETSIMGMTALRDHDEYTFTHSVNVCIFSVALGKKLGLDRQQLYELGLGALLHDVGKMRIPKEVMNKTGDLTSEDVDTLRLHPVEGLMAIFGMGEFLDLPLRPMLMVYEHHMKIDLTGYPRVLRPRRPTILPRIVALADGFDAATTKRVYQAVPWTPDRVLREMRDSTERGFDPLLVKAFISMTGIYPVGATVILDTFELAVVVAANPKAEALHQPVVRIVYDAMGQRIDDPPLVDLAETDPGTGQPRRTIVKATDPDRYGLRVGDYFV
jgi:HD-GYP domain-containing protein (c-di-GMP phosphodiesterase class II)